MDGNKLRGLVLQVNHTNYGTLFAAMIEGSGKLITETGENGTDLPFMTTEEILNQIMKFGFYVKYDLKSNLPTDEIVYLSMLYNLHYDKINVIIVRDILRDRTIVKKRRVLVFKVTEDNTDLLTYGKMISRAAFDRKLETNTVVDVTDECNGIWDWVLHVSNLSDILDENVDPVDEYETETDAPIHEFRPVVLNPVPSVAQFTGPQLDLTPAGFTPYVDPEEEGQDEPE